MPNFYLYFRNSGTTRLRGIREGSAPATRCRSVFCGDLFPSPRMAQPEFLDGLFWKSQQRDPFKAKTIEPTSTARKSKFSPAFPCDKRGKNKPTSPPPPQKKSPQISILRLHLPTAMSFSVRLPFMPNTSGLFYLKPLIFTISNRAARWVINPGAPSPWEGDAPTHPRAPAFPHPAAEVLQPAIWFYFLSFFFFLLHRHCPTPRQREKPRDKRGRAAPQPGRRRGLLPHPSHHPLGNIFGTGGGGGGFLPAWQPQPAATKPPAREKHAVKIK